MGSCLRSNLLTAVSMLLIASGIGDQGIQFFQEQARAFQAQNKEMVAQALQDSRDAAEASRKAALDSQKAAAAYEQKKTELEAQGCKR